MAVIHGQQYIGGNTGLLYRGSYMGADIRGQLHRGGNMGQLYRGSYTGTDIRVRYTGKL